MIKKEIEKLLSTDDVLDDKLLGDAERKRKSLSKKVEKEYRDLCLLEMLLEYNREKKNGKSKEELARYYKEDIGIIESANKYLKNHLELRKRMFGYPANMFEYNSVEKYLRYLESKMYLINNCGGSNPEIDRGNYLMDSKEEEMKIITLVCNNMNVEAKDYWGYITSGGTEGNFWGIKTGFELLPNSKLYYSNDAHYSIPKSVKIGNTIDLLPNESIKSSDMGNIDVDVLIDTIKRNYEENQKSAIIILTWGTTVYGACDDIKNIKYRLKKLNIPHYIHLDAAMYGGIGKNQTNSPAIKDLKVLDPDSISISFHKYIGSANVNGIIICKKEVYDKKVNKRVEYIGQNDPTYLGSRNYPPFSLGYRINRLYNREKSNTYEENINYFMEQMDKANIQYKHKENGNTFVINLPSIEFARKYQLATFDNDTKAHIIIFPYHSKKVIKELVNDLADCKM